MKLSFNIMQLLIERSNDVERFSFPTKEDFLSLSSSMQYTKDDDYYEILVEHEDNYMWLYFNYGSPNPRNNKLTNIITGEKKENQRGEDEAELTNQFFVLYYYPQNQLYISSIKKKTLLESFLTEYASNKFIVQSFYKSIDEIIATLHEVDKISFSNVKDLFNQDSKERKALVDLTGVDAPDSFSIETIYRKKWIPTNFIKSLSRAKRNNQISDLIINGRDEKDFAVVYNVDSFCRKIDIECDKDLPSGMFNADNVKSNLIIKIEQL